MAVIAPPDLEIRNVEKLAAQALARIAMPPSAALVRNYIGVLQNLLDVIESGSMPTSPLCPELTNVNPSATTVVIAEQLSWLLEQIAFRINQLPERDQIEFARMFVGARHDATATTAELQFTTTGQQEVTIPAGTEVSTADGNIVFATIGDLTIPFGETTGTVEALRTVAGVTLLAPNTLIRQVDQIAYVSAVTNTVTVDSGSGEETLSEYLERARSYQRRAGRLVSAKDYEEAAFQDVLRRNGIVKMFPFISAGDFAGGNKAGYSTMIVMTSSGNAVSDDLKAQIRTLINEQGQAGQFVTLLDPQYVNFNVAANVKISGFTSQLAVIASVEANLRAFYSPKTGNFGRRILRAEVIHEIEGTDGVDRVDPVDPTGPILITPVADTVLAPYQLPRLVSVTINVVP